MQFTPNGSVILFLQGPASPLWWELANACECRGARIVRVDFGLGDRLYWRRPERIAYGGRFEDWGDFLEALVRREGITDILYYGDRLPYHAVAARVAARCGVKCHAIENGYLRPDWLTLERDGMGAFSHFPNDPEVIRAIAAKLPPPDLVVRYRHGFAELAFHEVMLALFNFFGAPLRRFRYRSSSYYHPIREYLSWLPRLLSVRSLRRRAEALLRGEIAGPFWLLAMQLQSDHQIRSNSHYGHLSEMLDEILTSFARHAPKRDHLVVKLHPHDNSIERWDRVCARLAERHNLVGRVHVIDGGDLATLLERAHGVVLVNSTVGLHSLRASKPTLALGAAVYDMPGLTHQGGIDTFWTAPEPVDDELMAAFVIALAGTIQVKGDFYDPAGRRVACEEIAARVIEGRVNEPGAFVDPPPRLDGAAASALG